MTVELSAAIVEGVVVDGEPIVSGVELDGDIIEGALLAGEAISE